MSSSTGFPRGEGSSGALRDQSPFLFGQRGVQVKHQGVGIGAEFRHDEGDALGHQAGNEGDIPGEAFELGHQHRTLGLARCRQRCGELRPSIERIRALAGLDLGELRYEGDALGFGEAGDRCSLGFDAEA